MREGDRTLEAAGYVLIFAVTIGFTDNFVRVIAAEGGLWQFHAIRTAMVTALLAVLAVPLRLSLRPKRPTLVAARSALHGVAMLIYFGALAFLPVAQVAAGLFTAPIFVLLFSRFAFGHRVGPVRVCAVATGFAGVLMVLGPQAFRDGSPVAFVPIVAGAFYAMGNIATREWCRDESPVVVTLGFFLALGVAGVVGLAALGVFPLDAPIGKAGFVLRGWTAPSGAFLGWTFVQAAGSLFAVAMVVRAYQIADAGRVSVFEYMNLPAAAFWGWLLWGERLDALAATGMAMIALAGGMIAARAGQEPPARSPA